ncbi:DUF4232 domain-containing protein [Microbacterium sp. LWH13-1.2]|uniref:DUF4232 domain-containing protein n=1 Tax=Microbacterium sp. LWH13-1.2 TaxID=3135260 RepID=UPI00313A145E
MVGVHSSVVGSKKRVWLISATVGALWLVVVALSAAVSVTRFARVQEVVLPAGVTPYIWSWAFPWPVLLPIAGAIAVTLVHAAILQTVRGSERSVATVWLATVVAGAAAGLTVDVVLVFASLVTDGWAMWALELGSRAAVGAYWGLIYGWVPALIARRLARRDDARGAVESPSRRGWPIYAAAALAGLVLLGGAQVLGDEATQVQLRAESAASDPGPADGSVRPDPDAPGDPVPELVEGGGVIGDGACTPERAMVLIGDVSGATGHRGLRLELMNFSDAPCTIDGYPDVAFGDQNDHLLDVTIERGGSFMAPDPGQALIEIPAGSSAVAYLGWDANPTQGALVARTVWAAVLEGEVRGSKPIESDVVEGATVSVTAWALPEGGSTAP